MTTPANIDALADARLEDAKILAASGRADAAFTLSAMPLNSR